MYPYWWVSLVIKMISPPVQSTSPVHQSSPLLQSSDCRQPMLRRIFAYSWKCYHFECTAMISCKLFCTHSNNCPYCSHISCCHWFSGHIGSLFGWDVSGIGYLEEQCTVTKLQQKWSVWHSLLHSHWLHCPGICHSRKPYAPSLQPAASSQSNCDQSIRWCSSGPCD